MGCTQSAPASVRPSSGRAAESLEDKQTHMDGGGKLASSRSLDDSTLTSSTADPYLRGTQHEHTPSVSGILTPTSTQSAQLVQSILTGASSSDVQTLVSSGGNVTSLDKTGVSCILALACRNLQPNLLPEPNRDAIVLPALPGIPSLAFLSLLRQLVAAGSLPSLPWFTRIHHSAIGSAATLIPLSAAVLNGSADVISMLLAPPGRPGRAASQASQTISPRTAKAFTHSPRASSSYSQQTRSNSTVARLPASPTAMAALRALSGQTADTEGICSPTPADDSLPDRTIASYSHALGPVFLNGYVIFGVPSSADIPSDLNLGPIRLLTLDDAGYLGRSSEGSKSGRNSAKLTQPGDVAKALQQAVGAHAQMYAGEHTIHALHPLLLAAFSGSIDSLCQMLHLGSRCDLAIAYPATVQRWCSALLAEHSVNMRALNATAADDSASGAERSDSATTPQQLSASRGGRSKGKSVLAAVAEAASKEEAEVSLASRLAGSHGQDFAVAQNSRELSGNFNLSPQARHRRASGEQDDHGSGFYDAKMRDSTLSDARSMVSEHTIDPFSHEVRGGFKVTAEKTTSGAAGASGDGAAAVQLMAGADAFDRATWKKSGLEDLHSGAALNSARSTATVGQGWTLPHGKRNLVPAGSRLSHVAAKNGNVLTVCMDFSDCLVRAAAEAIVLEAPPSEVNRLLPTVELPRPSAAPAAQSADIQAVLATVMGGAAMSDAMQPNERLHACSPSFMWRSKEALDMCLPPLAMLLSSNSPGAHAHASLSADFWTTTRLSRLQQLVTVALDAVTVRSLLQAAGAFVQWRAAAATSMRNSPFATEHILFPEAGHRDRGVRHVLLRLAQHVDRRSVTQQTPLHALTRCITPRPAEHVLHAYCAEEDSPQLQLPPRVSSQLSSPGGEEPQSSNHSGVQRQTSHHSSRSAGYKNMPSSASEVFGVPTTLYRPRTVLDFWRESDTYVSQISTEGSSHLGRKADAWRHARATAEADWGWGDLANLERGVLSSRSKSGAQGRMPPPRSHTSGSGSAGVSAANTAGRTLPHVNYAADLSGLCLSSISQASLALSSFAEGCALGYARQLQVAPHSVSPLRFLVAPTVQADSDQGQQSHSTSASQPSQDEERSDESQLDMLLRDNFFAPLEAHYLPPAAGSSIFLPNRTGKASHKSSVAKGETGYAVDVVCALLRSTTALHMRQVVKQCTGQQLPLTCAGGVSAAALGCPRPNPLLATAGAGNELASVAATSYEQGGLPLYAQVGYRSAGRLGEEGSVRAGTAQLPPGTIQATQLHSVFGVGVLFLSSAVVIPEEACSASSSEMAALSKLLFSSMGMQQTARKLAKQQQERHSGLTIGNPAHTSFGSASGAGSPLAAVHRAAVNQHMHAHATQPVRMTMDPGPKAPERRNVSNQHSQISMGSDVLRADALTALDSGSAVTHALDNVQPLSSDGMSGMAGNTLPTSFGHALTPQVAVQRITLANNTAPGGHNIPHGHMGETLQVTFSTEALQPPGGGGGRGDIPQPASNSQNSSNTLNPAEDSGLTATLPQATTAVQGKWKIHAPSSSSDSAHSPAPGGKTVSTASLHAASAAGSINSANMPQASAKKDISVSLPAVDAEFASQVGGASGAASPPIPRVPSGPGSPPVASPPAAARKKGLKGKNKKRPGLKLQLGSARNTSIGSDRGLHLAAASGSGSSEDGAKQLQQLAELKGHTMAGYSVGVKPGGPAVLLTPSKLRQMADDNRSHASWDLSSTGTRDRGEDGPPGGAQGSLRTGSFRLSGSERLAPLLHSDGSSPDAAAASGGVAMSSSFGPRRSMNLSAEQNSSRSSAKYGMYKGAFQRLPGSPTTGGSVMSGLSSD